MIITEEMITSLTDRVMNMPEEQRLELDKICEAICLYREKHDDGPHMSSRIIGLLAIDATRALEVTIWNRE